MTNPTQDYAFSLLINLKGEWETKKEHWDRSMYGPSGPYQEGADFIDYCQSKIDSLEKAIKKLQE